MHKDFKKQTCHHAFNRAIILFTQLPHCLLFFSIIACSVLMALVFYYNDMLQKVTVQRTQQFSAFVCYRKNPVKCNVCAVARKIETDCFYRKLPISNEILVFPFLILGQRTVSCGTRSSGSICFTGCPRNTFS